MNWNSAKDRRILYAYWHKTYEENMKKNEKLKKKLEENCIVDIENMIAIQKKKREKHNRDLAVRMKKRKSLQKSMENRKKFMAFKAIAYFSRMTKGLG